MKRLSLGLKISGIILITTTTSYAIESGTYLCATPFGGVEVFLKDNGRAKVEFSKGFWQDYGDEALVIKKNWSLEDKGNGKYTFRGYNCKKTK